MAMKSKIMAIGSNTCNIAFAASETFLSQVKGKTPSKFTHQLMTTAKRQISAYRPNNKLLLGAEYSNRDQLASHRSLSSTSPQRDAKQHSQVNPENSELLFNEEKSQDLFNGPEPEYDHDVSGYKTFTYDAPFYFKYNKGVLPELNIAYETWGELNKDKSNAIMLSTGLSASSHAKSHADNTKPGWWEKFIGPGCAVDTNKYFVICTNTLGGCYGSTGPSSVNPMTGAPYGTTFPLLSVQDMVKAQFLLLDHMGIDKVYATVGSSLGGMCSLTSAVEFGDRVGRMISISSCGLSHPTSIAMRYLQRKSIMTDPLWQHGHYYGKSYPRNGMKMARELATMTYRSGPEWSERFARKRIDENEELALCPTFLIESYLDYQGEAFCTMYDPNSLLYISKAIDLFDIGENYKEINEAFDKITCPVMVIGVTTDILFPIWQQKQLAALCRASGNPRVTFYELDSVYGHDTFLLDLNGVGSAVKGFLDTEQRNNGRA